MKDISRTVGMVGFKSHAMRLYMAFFVGWSVGHICQFSVFFVSPLYARVFATEVAEYPVFFSYSLDKSGFVYRLYSDQGVLSPFDHIFLLTIARYSTRFYQGVKKLKSVLPLGSTR